MTLRVLLIIPTLDQNGAEKQLSLLAAGLPRDRFDVHVCALTRGGPLAAPLKAAGIPVTIIEKRWKFDPSAFFRLKRFIRDLKPDLVHTWIFAANSYGRAAAFSAGVRHVVAGERCVDPWKRWHELAIDRRLAKRTDRIVTNSSGVKDFYVERGLPGEKFVVIPNGISPFSPAESVSREDLLRELSLPADARLVGAVGRLWPQKRYKDLIWSYELMQNVHSNLHVLIIGDGPQRWRLERYARQTELDTNIHFLGERHDVPRILPHLECFLLASGYEGQSNALMEAMSASVPVVATNIPGNRDLVIPKETGFLVPVGDRAEIARWTNVILNDRDLALRLGRAGRDRMLQEFSVEKMIERHAKLYEEIC